MKLSLTDIPSRPAILHIGINGKWSVLEFTQLLEKINYLCESRVEKADKLPASTLFLSFLQK